MHTIGQLLAVQQPSTHFGMVADAISEHLLERGKEMSLPREMDRSWGEPFGPLAVGASAFAGPSATFFAGPVAS